MDVIEDYLNDDVYFDEIYNGCHICNDLFSIKKVCESCKKSYCRYCIIDEDNVYIYNESDSCHNTHNCPFVRLKQIFQNESEEELRELLILIIENRQYIVSQLKDYIKELITKFKI
jgi:hypothetical protein